jgi:hypothetical protein
MAMIGKSHEQIPQNNNRKECQNSFLKIEIIIQWISCLAENRLV